MRERSALHGANMSESTRKQSLCPPLEFEIESRFAACQSVFRKTRHAVSKGRREAWAARRLPEDMRRLALGQVEAALLEAKAQLEELIELVHRGATTPTPASPAAGAP